MAASTIDFCIGAALGRYRRHLALSTARMADLAELDETWLQGAERGEHRFCPCDILKLARALHLDVSHLLPGCDFWHRPLASPTGPHRTSDGGRRLGSIAP